MKKFITTAVLALSLTASAQVQSDLKYDTPGFKVAQGFVIGGVTDLMLRNTDMFGDAPILRGVAGVLTSALLESAMNGFRPDKIGYVAAGSVTASIVINIWDPAGPSVSCGRRRW